MSEQCTTAYNNALKEAAKTAPKYATREDCVAEFGEAQCTCAPAPAQAGMAAESQKQRQLLDAADGGLHDGSPDGRLRLRAAAAVHLKNAASPANGKFVDASGKSYGPATAGGRTMTVPKPPWHEACGHQHRDPRRLRRDRGKQSSMQRSSATSNSGSRSMGG